MKKGLVNSYCPNVVAQYEVVASVKENLHEFIEDPKKNRKAQMVEGVSGTVKRINTMPKPTEQSYSDP